MLDSADPSVCPLYTSTDIIIGDHKTRCPVLLWTVRGLALTVEVVELWTQ